MKEDKKLWANKSLSF